LRPKLTVVY